MNLVHHVHKMHYYWVMQQNLYGNIALDVAQNNINRIIELKMSNGSESKFSGQKASIENALCNVKGTSRLTATAQTPMRKDG